MARQKRSEVLTSSIFVRATEELKDKAKIEADRVGMSLQDWLLDAIEFRIANPPENNPTPNPTEAIDIDAKFQEINDRLEALEAENIQIKKQCESGTLPPKTAPKALPKKAKTIAPVGTIADQILQLMADGREWSNKELGTHFPGKRITSALSRLKGKGAIEQVKSESGKEIPGVHRIVKA